MGYLRNQKKGGQENLSMDTAVFSFGDGTVCGKFGLRIERN